VSVPSVTKGAYSENFIVAETKRYSCTAVGIVMAAATFWFMQATAKTAMR
jgi:hypothetical protein